jgi:hypothetical protein
VNFSRPWEYSDAPALRLRDCEKITITEMIAEDFPGSSEGLERRFPEPQQIIVF